MKSLTIGIAAAAVMCVSAEANAQSFTFKSKTHATNAVSVGSEETLITDVISKSDVAITYDNGEKEQNATTCANWTVPPGTPFTSSGICTFVTKSGGKGTIVFSCHDDAKTNLSDCWGALRGTAGRFKGKTGTISWHQVVEADGMTGNDTGTGMWN
jgi:hypothetical protein